MRDRRILATVAALLGAAAVAVFVAFDRDSGGPDSPVAVASAMDQCVLAASGPPPPQGPLSPPPSPSDDFDFPIPTAYHDWERGTGLYVHDDEELAFLFFEVSGLGVVSSGEGTAIEHGSDGSITVSYEGEGALIEGEQYGLAVFFWGMDADDSEPKQLTLEVHGTLRADGSAGSATAVIDGTTYSMEAALAPENAEDVACAILQSSVAGDWKAVLEAMPDFTEGLDVDELAEEIRREIADMGTLTSAVLDGPLNYEQHSDLGYPVAYGRAKLTFEKGELTTTEGSNIALIYRGSWQLLDLSPADEFEDLGTGDPVVIDPVEGGLVRYTAGEGLGQSLVVQTDPEHPMAGRFVYTDLSEGIFWSRTPGELFVGDDGMTHLKFDGEGLRRARPYLRFNEGGVFEPPDAVLLPGQDLADHEEEFSRPERFSLEVTFRDGGERVNGTISTDYGTQRFALNERIPGPDKVLTKALAALKAEDWQTLGELLEDPTNLKSLRERIPYDAELERAGVWPEVSWWEDTIANQHGYFRNKYGIYWGFRIQAEWSREDRRWWIHLSRTSVGLKPTVCVQQELDGSLTAHFGYMSDLGGALTIPAGQLNRITGPGGGDLGQVTAIDMPTVFEPGVHNRVVSLKVDGPPPVWTLNASFAVPNPSRARPPTQEGNSSADEPCR